MSKDNPKLTFNGQRIRWKGVGSFPATTGMPNRQKPKFQCTPDKGPVPEGLYYLRLWWSQDNEAIPDDWSRCTLKPSWHIQTIPRGDSAQRGGHNCDPYWANWGQHRVRIEPANRATKNACEKSRDGFYIHDSTKGFSHGCIEVDEKFFTELKRKAKQSDGKLYLEVKYNDGVRTNGGTKEN